MAKNNLALIGNEFNWGTALRDYILALEDVARAAEIYLSAIDNPTELHEINRDRKALRDALDKVEIRDE
jgi:hypothetical protein